MNANGQIRPEKLGRTQRHYDTGKMSLGEISELLIAKTSEVVEVKNRSGNIEELESVIKYS